MTRPTRDDVAERLSAALTEWHRLVVSDDPLHDAGETPEAWDYCADAVMPLLDDAHDRADVAEAKVARVEAECDRHERWPIDPEYVGLVPIEGIRAALAGDDTTPNRTDRQETR